MENAWQRGYGTHLDNSQSLLDAHVSQVSKVSEYRIEIRCRNRGIMLFLDAGRFVGMARGIAALGIRLRLESL